MLLENIANDKWFVLIGRAKYVEKEDILSNEENGDIKIKVGDRKENGFFVEFVKGFSLELFEKCGHTPLPPYIKREDKKSDKERYNTVFSQIPGAVAAPTASLNLTEEILREIKGKGAQIVKVELRVNWGTFAPIRDENIEDHKIHEEYISIDERSASVINEGIINGTRIWAFGTTVARTLESVVYLSNDIGIYLVKSFNGKTDLCPSK